MKTKLVTLILGAAALAGAAGAADSSSPSGTVSIPTTPAPAIAATAAAPVAAPSPTPNQIVYTPRLPSPAELTNAATAQGLSVERLEQTATQILAVYRSSNGQLNTVAYQTLPPSGATTSASAPVVAMTSQQSAPTVVYDSAPRVVYYDSYDPFYYPRVYYPPVSLRLGFGFGYHGGFRGGSHHWR